MKLPVIPPKSDESFFIQIGDNRCFTGFDRYGPDFIRGADPEDEVEGIACLFFKLETAKNLLAFIKKHYPEARILRVEETRTTKITEVKNG